MVQPSSSSLIITSMMMISINTNLRWVDVISRAGHRTGEHEGGDSLQLPGLELSVKIIIIVLRRHMGWEGVLYLEILYILYLEINNNRFLPSW